MEIAPALPVDFASRVLNEIFSHHQDRVCRLAERYSSAERRYVVTSDARFAFPFSYTVVHGLRSGEGRDNLFLKLVNRRLCNQAIRVSYRETKTIVKPSAIREALSDLFNVSYGLGTEFHGVENFRNTDGTIGTLTPEQGARFIYPMVDGMSISVDNPKRFAGEVWSEYAKGRAPHLFIKT